MSSLAAKPSEDSNAIEDAASSPSVVDEEPTIDSDSDNEEDGPAEAQEVSKVDTNVADSPQGPDLEDGSKEVDDQPPTVRNTTLFLLSDFSTSL